jgi:hypothetical protein
MRKKTEHSSYFFQSRAIVPRTDSAVSNVNNGKSNSSREIQFSVLLVISLDDKWLLTLLELFKGRKLCELIPGLMLLLMTPLKFIPAW